ncbi:macro domain-containing protein [Nocardia sp. MW-W600-9]
MICPSFPSKKVGTKPGAVQYARAARMGDLHVGRMFVWETGAAHGPRLIVNFPTKRHWRSASRLDDVSAGLPALAETIERYRIQSIAIFALGCGHGGLAWERVGPADQDGIGTAHRHGRDQALPARAVQVMATSQDVSPLLR